MAKKLSDKKIKEIIALRTEGVSYTKIAKKYKISVNTVKNYCNSDEDFAQKCNIKKRENAKNVLEHMSEQADIVCEIIDKVLVEMTDTRRLKESNTRELATALGIIIDKFSRADNSEMSKLDEVLGKIEGNI